MMSEGFCFYDIDWWTQATESTLLFLILGHIEVWYSFSAFSGMEDAAAAFFCVAGHELIDTPTAFC